MTLLYATDLHGDLEAYEALIAIALAEKAAALILSGDLVEYHPRAAPQIAFVEGPLAGLLARLREAGDGSRLECAAEACWPVATRARIAISRPASTTL